MVRSMFSGVSGLRSHQTMMDVIGNNIANVNTFGYKASRATFRDVYYQTLNGATTPTKKGTNNTSGGGNPNQVGYGVAVNTIDTMMTQSGFSFTDNGLDVAIAGEGFFQVQTPDGSKLYTRAGILDIDANGNVVDAGNNFVLGVNSNMSAGKSTTKPAISSVYKFTNGVSGQFTTGNPGVGDSFEVDFAIGTPAAATWAKDKVTITLEDGKEYTKSDIQKLVDDSYKTASAADPDILKLGGLKVEIDGKMQFSATLAVPAAGAISLKVPDEILSDVYVTHKDQNSGILPGNTNKINVLDNFNSVLKGLGRPAASNDDFKSISISKNGEIVGNHSEFGLVVLGRLDIATFSNPRGLSQEGSNYFSETGNSGKPNSVTPGTEGGGALSPGSLELSNVDLSKEFSNMITTQRGFQANSRIITVSDEMLQELVNLKR
ncbi:MAG: flagellar hook-basal body complex protein [Oscillospiraceae bacterium]